MSAMSRKKKNWFINIESICSIDVCHRFIANKREREKTIGEQIDKMFETERKAVVTEKLELKEYE